MKIDPEKLRAASPVIFLRPAQAAALVGVSPRAISAEMAAWTASRGKRGLPFFFAGRGRMVTTDGLRRWAESGERASAGL